MKGVEGLAEGGPGLKEGWPEWGPDHWKGNLTLADRTAHRT